MNSEKIVLEYFEVQEPTKNIKMKGKNEFMVKAMKHLVHHKETGYNYLLQLVNIEVNNYLKTNKAL